MAENLTSFSGDEAENIPWQNSLYSFERMAELEMNTAIYEKAWADLQKFADTTSAADAFDFFTNDKETAVLAGKVARDMVTVVSLYTQEPQPGFTNIPIDSNRDFRLGLDSERSFIWCAIGTKLPDGSAALAIQAYIPLASEISELTMKATVYPQHRDGTMIDISPSGERSDDASAQRYYLYAVRKVATTLLEVAPSSLSNLQQAA